MPKIDKANHLKFAKKTSTLSGGVTEILLYRLFSFMCSSFSSLKITAVLFILMGSTFSGSEFEFGKT